MKSFIVFIAFLLASTAFANATRTLDGAQITNGAATLALPSSSDTLVGRATTDTLTNKSINGGSNTLSNIPSSALSNTAVTAGSYTNANITVNAQGQVTSAANGTGATPALNGGSGSAQSVTAVGGVSLSSQIPSINEAWLAGSGGPVTVTKTPSVTAGSTDGEILKLIGTSATNTVTLQDQSNLASSGLSLNGNWIASKDSVITLHWDATQSLWVEDSRR